MRTRSSYEISAFLYELHSENVYILISSVSVLDVVGALAERGRIKYHDVEFSVFLFIFPQCVEYVGAFRFYYVSEAVQFRIYLYFVKRPF